MLKSQQEIDIVKDAWEPNLRSPIRPVIHFERILKYYFRKYNFKNKLIWDLGPGHYDFAELIIKRGAKVVSLELDPAIIKLGEHRGMNVVRADLKQLLPTLPKEQKLDGLFCRGSIDAFWFYENKNYHKQYLTRLCELVKDDGFIWFSPANDGSGVNDKNSINETLTIQNETLLKNGLKCTRLNPISASRIGVTSITKPLVVYTKNLPNPYLIW